VSDYPRRGLDIGRIETVDLGSGPGQVTAYAETGLT
jgi:hypothetical protein